MKKVYDWFGGRRYFFAEQVFVVSTVLLCIDKIKSSDYIQVIIWTLAIYVGGNVLQKYSEGKKHDK